MARIKAITVGVLCVLFLTGPAHAFTLPLPHAVSLVPASTGSTYVEVGDAGDRFSPQAIAGIDISIITGDIGGLGDPVDAFKFFFAGGGIAFVGTATFGDGGITPDALIPLPLRLFLGVGFHPPDPIVPDFESLVGSVIAFSALPAGNYIIEGTFVTDPPFSIGVFTLNPDGTPGIAPQVIQAPGAVPAPASALLLTLGLVGLWRAGRRLRPR